MSTGSYPRRSRRPKSRTYQCASLHRNLQLSGGTSATPVTFITAMRNLNRKSVNEIFSGTSKVCSCCSAWCGEESLPGLVFRVDRSSLQPLLLRRRHEPSASSSSPGSRRRSGFTWGRIMYCRKREMLWPWERESRKCYKRFTTTPVIAMSAS